MFTCTSDWLQLPYVWFLSTDHGRVLCQFGQVCTDRKFHCLFEATFVGFLSTGKIDIVSPFEIVFIRTASFACHANRLLKRGRIKITCRPCISHGVRISMGDFQISVLSVSLGLSSFPGRRKQFGTCRRTTGSRYLAVNAGYSGSRQIKSRHTCQLPEAPRTNQGLFVATLASAVLQVCL